LNARLHLRIGYALGRNTGFVEFNDYANSSTAYGTQPDDRRHRLTVSTIWDLPEYEGRGRLRRSLLNAWSVALISETDSPPPLDTMLAGLDLDGDGISRTLLPGISRHNTLGRELSRSELTKLVDAFNADVAARTRSVAMRTAP
jgi:hypothetical protein